MSRSQKPRHKKRTPIFVNKNACLIAIERTRVLRKPVDEAYASEFEMAALTSLDVITRGYGEKPQWDVLANCLNQAWLLARAGHGPEAREIHASAHDAMRRMVPEFEKSGRITFVSDDDRKAVELSLDIWFQQLRMATIGEIDAATDVVHKEYWKRSERRAA
jgi:hypothetical protein